MTINFRKIPKAIPALIFTLILALMPLGAISPVGAADDGLIVLAQNPIKVTVDGTTVIFPDTRPYADANQRVLVPIKFPMDAMGVTSVWDGAARTATLTKGETVAVFTIDSVEYTVNGQVKTMDTVAIADGGRTLFPIRFAAEAFGATVSWDGANSTVVITTKDAAAAVPKPSILTYPQDKANLREMALLEFRPTGNNMQGIKVQCVNNDTVNDSKLLGRLDDSYNGDYQLTWNTFYGADGSYQVQPGEVLIFDVWVEYWPDGEPVQEALVYDDYAFTVPDYN